jgi:hypothetical protein
MKILKHDVSSENVGIKSQLSNSVSPFRVIPNSRYWLLFTHQDGITVPSIHSATNCAFSLQKTEQIAKCINR